jgi:GDPmannose 4,6-dehydratase
MKKAIITGVSGQDGSYLAELLLENGYEVWGILRRHSLTEQKAARLEAIGLLENSRLNLVYGDVTDFSSLSHLCRDVQPDEIYNLAAQSHVGISFQQPSLTSKITGESVLTLLECARQHCSNAKIYQAGTSEMFGNNIDTDGFQRETTKMSPVSPYGCAKLYAHNMCKVYRTSYDMFVCNGILFNHESPRRGLNFVTNKIVKGAVDIYYKKENKLLLGNLEARRDWGHAKDYVKAMHLMLQHNSPDDWVVSTGISHSVRNVCEYVFTKLGLDYKNFVEQDSRYIRPKELHVLKGDSTKIRTNLGWKPTYTFETMMDEMIQYWISIEEK